MFNFYRSNIFLIKPVETILCGAWEQFMFIHKATQQGVLQLVHVFYTPVRVSSYG